MPEALEVSLDEIMSKRSHGDSGIIYRAAPLPRSLDIENRSVRFVMTDETVDRYGDIVHAKGADMKDFLGNPIALLNHSHSRAIGNWSDVSIKGKAIEGIFNAAPEGTTRDADEAFNLLQAGILRACSIGFIPTKMKRRLDEKGEPLWSYEYEEWTMLECSIVSVPANPAALAKSIRSGNGLALQFIEEVLDTYTRDTSGLIIPRATLEAIHKQGTGSGESVVVTDPVVETAPVETTETVELSLEFDEAAFHQVMEDNAEKFIKVTPAKKGIMERVLAFLKGNDPTVEEPAPDPAPVPEKADQDQVQALVKRLEALKTRQAA